eukprot:TRINITY_DN77370_c0_g1_i1.p1 TRINITY_DN77370_c0_g1~~TRINITY_DN77370_c0_g1_i1.p1  ORF type:complete len:181 (+),score=51.57 TRINITY_DN77370_c0_g1_i1:74-544(+)
MAARFAAAVALALAVGGNATTLRRQSTVSKTQKWMPFGLDKIFAPQHAKAKEPASVVSAPASTETMQSVKDSVILSASFGHKTQELCKAAPADEMTKCRELAGDRLFCSLLKRAKKKFDGVPGLAEEQDKCKNIDILTDAAGAAQDEHLEKMAQDA